MKSPVSEDDSHGVCAPCEALHHCRPHMLEDLLGLETRLVERLEQLLGVEPVRALAVLGDRARAVA
jgi:hypothetical protein